MVQAIGWPQPGTPHFNYVWKSIAAQDPAAFGQAQHRYIERTHFQPAAARIQKVTGLDVSASSNAVQDVLWSTSVQHNRNAPAIVARAMNAVSQLGMQPGTREYESALIKAMYQERGRVNSQGVMVNFKSSPQYWPGLKKRFIREEGAAQKELYER